LFTARVAVVYLHGGLVHALLSALCAISTDLNRKRTIRTQVRLTCAGGDFGGDRDPREEKKHKQQLN
jgi:hypothetical protein